LISSSEHEAKQLLTLDEMTSNALALLPGSVLLLDPSLRVVWTNRAFLESWGSLGEIWGRPLEALLPREDATEELWTAIERTAHGQQPFEGLVVRGAWGKSTNREVRWSGRVLDGGTERGSVAVLIADPIAT
jgi:PAS domain-containing protein